MDKPTLSVLIPFPPPNYGLRGHFELLACVEAPRHS